jgi:hypothetical protein
MFSHRSNALLDEIQRRGRQRLAHDAVPSDNGRALLRALKRNAAVWHAPDQMHSNGELLPFFGPAMTSLATSKLARLSGAPVVPFSFRRSDERGHYELEFHEPARDVQTADARASTRALVSRLEDFIRAAPEQYQMAASSIQGPSTRVARSVPDSTICALTGVRHRHTTTLVFALTAGTAPADDGGASRKPGTLLSVVRLLWLVLCIMNKNAHACFEPSET